MCNLVRLREKEGGGKKKAACVLDYQIEMKRQKARVFFSLSFPTSFASLFFLQKREKTQRLSEYRCVAVEGCIQHFSFVFLWNRSGAQCYCDTNIYV